MKRLVNRCLRYFGLRLSKIKSSNVWTNDQAPDIFHSVIEPLATFSPWIADKEFMLLHDKASKNSLIDIYRLYCLFMLAKQVRFLGGSYLEVGVWRGGSALVISQAMAADQKLFLADTFNGVAKSGIFDTDYKDGHHSDTSKESVHQLLLDVDFKNFSIIEGVFPDSVSNALRDIKFSFVHLDVDVYQSVKESLDFLYPQILKGGIVVIDDYGFFGCEGVARYILEVQKEDLFTVIYNLSGQAILIKN